MTVPPDLQALLAAADSAAAALRGDPGNLDRVRASSGLRRTVSVARQGTVKPALAALLTQATKAAHMLDNPTTPKAEREAVASALTRSAIVAATFGRRNQIINP